MTIQKLELYYNEDGDPGQRKLVGDKLEFSEYDVSLGKEFDFFIRNPNHNIICDISELHTENPNSSFHGPDKILPLETVKCKIKIKAIDSMNTDNFDLSNEFEAIDYSRALRELQGTHTHDKLEGKIMWKNISFAFEDTTTIYGGWK